MTSEQAAELITLLSEVRQWCEVFGVFCYWAGGYMLYRAVWYAKNQREFW